MINFITRLEKSKTFWSLLIIGLFFFLLRLPSLIEPNWYGDEAIYQVMGMAMNHGQMLYGGIWDNKPPLLYVTYALFHSDQFAIRTASLISGMLSLFLFFLLSQKLFKHLRSSIIAASLFTLLFATPFIEGNIANAENFMLLPIIAAGFLLYRKREKHLTKTMLLVIGLLLGIAFLFKIVAVFDFAAFFLFLLVSNVPNKLQRDLSHQKTWLIPFLYKAFFMILGFIIPLSITILYFAINNALPDFIRATFLGNVGYVGYGNKLIIPQGYLILKLILLSGFMILLFWRRKSLSLTQLFIFLWFGFSLFNAFFSQRPYPHYLIVLIPSFCLLVGLLATKNKKQLTWIVSGLVIISCYIIVTAFHLSGFQKKIDYYRNAILFVSGNKTITDYQHFFDRKTSRDYAVASFLKLHTNPNDRILVWGDNSQIYVLSQTLPINKYTVAYHIIQNNNGVAETQQAITTVRPKYIVILDEAPSFPFEISTYTNKYMLDGAIIYETAF